MISQAEAKQIGEAYLNTQYPLEGDELIILDEYASETDEAWVFHYNSRLFLETNQPQYSMMFHALLYVDKITKQCELRM